MIGTKILSLGIESEKTKTAEARTAGMMIGRRIILNLGATVERTKSTQEKIISTMIGTTMIQGMTITTAKTNGRLMVVLTDGTRMMEKMPLQSHGSVVQTPCGDRKTPAR